MRLIPIPQFSGIPIKVHDSPLPNALGLSIYGGPLSTVLQKKVQHLAKTFFEQNFAKVFLNAVDQYFLTLFGMICKI